MFRLEHLNLSGNSLGGAGTSTIADWLRHPDVSSLVTLLLHDAEINALALSPVITKGLFTRWRVVAVGPNWGGPRRGGVRFLVAHMHGRFSLVGTDYVESLAVLDVGGNALSGTAAMALTNRCARVSRLAVCLG